MTKKGLFVTLLTVTFAFFKASSFANAPVISDPGDVVIGDLEQGANNNVFVFPDAIALDSIVSDDNSSASEIKWSYTSSVGHVIINGIDPLGGGDDPTNPPSNLQLNGNDSDVALHPPNGTQDTNTRTITFRNQFWSDKAADNGSGTPGLGPYADPGTTATGVFEQEFITLYASDCTTYSFKTITVYTSNDTSDSISGGVTMTLIRDDNYAADPSLIAGWYGGVQSPLLATTGTNTGLCMWVGAVQNATAVNNVDTVGWISPPNFTSGGPTASTGFVTLTDKTVYRLRLTMYTDQTAVGAIPFWNVGYNNANFTGVGAPGNTYGGEYWMLDVAGGAVGINDPAVNGRTQGRTSFDYWIAPDAMLTDQWRGTLTGALASENANSPFDPAYSTVKDFSLLIRILDVQQNTGIHNESDLGTVCVKELRIESIAYDQLASLGSLTYGTPNITLHSAVTANDAGFAVNPDDFFGGGNGTGTIDDVTHTATFRMGPNYTPSPPGSLGGRKSLIFYNPTQVINTPTDPNDYNGALAPITWNNDELLQLRVGIRSGVGGGTGTVEGTDPVETIFINWIAQATAEIGGYNFTQLGVAGDMPRAASPRLQANTGGVSQTYTGFLYTQNASVVDTVANPTLVYARRINGYPDFINNASLGGSATNGLDAFIIDNMSVYTIDVSGLN